MPGELTRENALLVLKEKREATGDDNPPVEKAKTDVSELRQQKLDIEAADLRPRENKLVLKYRELSLKESEAEQAKKSTKQLRAQAQDL